MEHQLYKLSSGLDVFNSLNELNTSNNSRSFVINAVGDLSKVSFKCPLNEKPIIIEKKLEIITLSGYLSPTGSHLHVISLSLMRAVVSLRTSSCWDNCSEIIRCFALCDS